MICEDCKQQVFPAYGSHHCVVELGGERRILWKVYNAKLGAWVIQYERMEEKRKPKDGPDEFSYYDLKKNEWVTCSFANGKLVDDSKAEGAQEPKYLEASCELPPRESTRHESRPFKTIEPVKPWEGVDRNKWPSTWSMLVFLYFQPDWWKGRWMSDDIYRLRLKGEYGQEKAVSYYNQRYYYGEYD